MASVLCSSRQLLQPGWAHARSSPRRRRIYAWRSPWRGWTLKASSGCSCPGKIPDNFTMSLPPSSPSQASSSRHRRVRGRRSNPLPLALSPALYHILSYTHSFLTAQFVLLLTAQGFSERWGGWPCSWVALTTPAPAAARPWPQRWPGRSIPSALWSLSGPPNPAAKAVSRGQPWVLGRSLLD